MERKATSVGGWQRGSSLQDRHGALVYRDREGEKGVIYALGARLDGCLRMGCDKHTKNKGEEHTHAHTWSSVD